MLERTSTPRTLRIAAAFGILNRNAPERFPFELSRCFSSEQNRFERFAPMRNIGFQRGCTLSCLLSCLRQPKGMSPAVPRIFPIRKSFFIRDRSTSWRGREAFCPPPASSKQTRSEQEIRMSAYPRPPGRVRGKAADFPRPRSVPFCAWQSPHEQ